MPIPLISAFIRLRPDATGFKAETETKLKNLSVKVKLEPKVDKALLKSALAALKAELKKVNSFKVKPVLDDAKWKTDIARWEAKNLKDRTFKVKPKLDASTFSAGQVADQKFKVEPVLELRNFRAQFALFRQVYLDPIRYINVEVNIDPDHLRALTRGPTMRRAGSEGGKTFSDSFLGVLGRVFKTGFSKILLKALAAAPALLNLLPLLTELATASGALGAALPAALTAVLAPALTLKLAFTGIGDAFKEAFTGDDPEKLAEALNKLAPPARRFVQEISSFKPQLTGLQQAIQGNFFAPLVGGFKSLVSTGLIKQLREQLGGIATDAGKTARGMLDIVTASAKAGQINAIFATARSIFAGIAVTLPGLVQTFLTLAVHGGAFAKVLTGGVAAGLQKFNDLVAAAAQDGRLDALLANGLAILKQLGSVLLDLGSIFKSVFQGLTAGSEGVLGPLSAVLDTLAKFLKTAEAQDALRLLGETLNALGEAVRSILVPLLPVVAKLASILGSVLSQAVLDLAPALAGFAEVLAKILTMIITTGEPILRVLVSVLSDFLVQALTEVTKHMDKMLPVLEDLLAELGPALVPVVEEFGKALLELVPIIPEISRAIFALVPILVELTPLMVFFLENTALLMKGLAFVIRDVTVPVIKFFVDNLVALGIVGKAIIDDLTKRWGQFATWFRTNVWETWLGPTVQFLIGAFGRFRDNAVSVLSAIVNFATGWWNTLRNNIFNPLITFVTVNLPQAFSRAADFISTAFGRVTGFIRGIANGVIGVINGVIRAFNVVAKAVGVGTIGEVGGLADGGPVGGGGGGAPPKFTMNGGLVAAAPMTMPNPQRRADGGMAFPYSFAKTSRPGPVHGAGGGRADRVPLWASAGEFVVNTAATRIWRPVLEWINQHGLRGVATLPQGREPVGRAAGGLVQHRAFGGIVDSLTDAWDALTNPAKWVGDRVNGLIDRIPGHGIMRDIGVGMGKKLVGGLIKWVKDKLSFSGGESPGFPPWPRSPAAQRGDSGVWRAIVALIRSTGPISGTFGNAYRPGDPLWHGSGRAVDWMGYNQDILATFLASRRPLELIHRTNRRDYAYTRGVNKGSFNNTLMEQHRNHVHAAFARGGIVARAMGRLIPGLAGGGVVLPAGRIRSYDNGGPFPNNSIGVNTSGATEYVSSADKMDRLIAEVRALANLTRELIATTAGVGSDVGRQLTGGAAMLRRTARAR